MRSRLGRVLHTPKGEASWYETQKREMSLLNPDLGQGQFHARMSTSGPSALPAPCISCSLLGLLCDSLIHWLLVFLLVRDPAITLHCSVVTCYLYSLFALCKLTVTPFLLQSPVRWSGESSKAPCLGLRCPSNCDREDAGLGHKPTPPGLRLLIPRYKNDCSGKGSLAAQPWREEPVGSSS